MIFKDLTQITVISGKGGAGLVSFKRASNRPKLGPDGGDGGFGGSVYFVGNKQLNSLSILRYKHEYKAEDGQKGGPNGRTGRNGQDLLIEVPLGTIAYDLDNSVMIGELTTDGQKLLLAQGGKRGLGNMRFLSSTHQAPEEHTLGGESITVNLQVELKLIADLGLAGFPNAGKSSLLAKISSAKPKIADYPFTTLTPNLGVVDMYEEDNSITNSFVIADIPGLIEGASQGRGLGFEFLRHLERTKMIAYVIDGSEASTDPVKIYEKLNKELNSYSAKFKLKPSFIILNKIDLIDQNRLETIEQKINQLGLNYLKISALCGTGLKELKFFIYNELKKISSDQTEISETKDLKIQLQSQEQTQSLDKNQNDDIFIDGFKLVTPKGR